MLRRLFSRCSAVTAFGKRRRAGVLHMGREHCYRVILITLGFLLLLQYGFNILVIRKHYLLTNIITGYVGNGTESGSGVRWGDGPQKFLHFLLRAPKAAPPPLCPEEPPGLVGAIPVTFEKPTLEEMEQQFQELHRGGRWRPSNCTARHRVALVVPYRDREHHLRIFINHIHPFLQKQQLDYGIYLIEQTSTSTFNRAMLLNIGFVEARKDYDYQCYIFHDVDLLPEDDRNLYDCPPQPRHMSAHVDTLAYRLPYDNLFGGIEAFSKEHFEMVNGFSNKFFGWGAEDDDMYNRLNHHDLVIIRYPKEIARYKMIRHMKQYPSSRRFKYLYTGNLRFENDGINNLKYSVVKHERRRIFTRILVNISEEQVLAEDRELLMLADLAPQYRDAIIGAEVAARQMSNAMGEGIAQEYRGGGQAVPEEGDDSDVPQNLVPVTQGENSKEYETRDKVLQGISTSNLVQKSEEDVKDETILKQSVITEEGDDVAGDLSSAPKDDEQNKSVSDLRKHAKVDTGRITASSDNAHEEIVPLGVDPLQTPQTLQKTTTPKHSIKKRKVRSKKKGGKFHSQQHGPGTVNVSKTTLTGKRRTLYHLELPES